MSDTAPNPKQRKYWAISALLGSVMGIVPLIGPLAMSVLLVTRKKYGWLIFTLIPAALFIGLMVMDPADEDKGLIKLRAEEKIAGRLFSMTFDADSPYLYSWYLKERIIEELDPIFEDIVVEGWHVVTLTQKTLPHYEKALRNTDTHVDGKFTLMPSSRQDLREGIADTAHWLSRHRYPDSKDPYTTLYNAFLFFWMVGIIAYAIFSYYWLFPPVKSTATGAMAGIPVGTVGETGTSAAPVTVTPIYVNMGDAGSIKAAAGITDLQARQIVSEREQNGPFLNLEDFKARGGLTTLICERIAPAIDFQYLAPPVEEPRGRVIDY